MTISTPQPTGEPHYCMHCGRAITVSARTPRKRYCSPRCRVADWHRRNDRQAPNTGEPDTVPEPPYATNAVPTAVPGHETASSRCPHCRRPVTAITLLVTPAAAQVTTPTTPGSAWLTPT